MLWVSNSNSRYCFGMKKRLQATAAEFYGLLFARGEPNMLINNASSPRKQVTALDWQIARVSLIAVRRTLLRIVDVDNRCSAIAVAEKNIHANPIRSKCIVLPMGDGLRNGAVGGEEVG